MPVSSGRGCSSIGNNKALKSSLQFRSAFVGPSGAKGAACRVQLGFLLGEERTARRAPLDVSVVRLQEFSDERDGNRPIVDLSQLLLDLLEGREALVPKTTVEGPAQ